MPPSRWIAFALTLSSLAVAACAPSTPSPGVISKATGSPKSIERCPPKKVALTVNPASLQLGTFFTNESREHSFVVHNPTSSLVAIERFASSCECTQVTPEVHAIGPGESAALTAHIKMSWSSLSWPQPIVTPFSVKIRCEAVDGGRAEWIFPGTLLCPLALDQPHFDFSADDITSPPILVVRKHHTVKEVRAESDSSELIATPIDFSPDAYEVGFDLSPSEDAPLGDFQTQLQIIASLEDGSDFHAHPIDVRGCWQGDLDWSPRQLVLAGQGELGDRDSVHLSSRSGQPLELVSLEFPNEKFEVINDVESSRSSAIVLQASRTSQPVKTGNETASLLATVRIGDTTDPVRLRLPVWLLAATSTPADGATSPEESLP